MQRFVAGILILFGILVSLAMIPAVSTNELAAAQPLLGETPTLPAPTATPLPVGGHLSMVDRGAVVQANLEPLIALVAASVIIIGVVALVVIRHRPTA